jgi:aarF domain-containing kinase
VHFATYNGIDVAVKVRHPGVAKKLSIDFLLMRWAADFVSQFPSLAWLNLKQSVEAFSATMTGQTFLDIEGNHLAIFNHNFRKWDDVTFPRPLVSSESVLVETFEKGKLVSSYTCNGCDERLPLSVAHFVVTRGEDIYLKMLLSDGLMHADLHPVRHLQLYLVVCVFLFFT